MPITLATRLSNHPVRCVSFSGLTSYHVLVRRSVFVVSPGVIHLSARPASLLCAGLQENNRGATSYFRLANHVPLNGTGRNLSWKSASAFTGSTSANCSGQKSLHWRKADQHVPVIQRRQTFHTVCLNCTSARAIQRHLRKFRLRARSRDCGHSKLAVGERLQISVCSEKASASSASIPRYLTVLSSLVCPSSHAS
jgi:hypothetical protein